MEKPEQESGKWLVSVMGVMIFLALVFGISISIAYIYGVDDLFPSLIVRNNWGVVGDFFGGILNPVFAFLGLIMLLATLYQSQKELSLTRKEFAKSVEVLDDQAKTQRQQRFENTFFSLLEQHNKFADAVKATKYEIPWDRPRYSVDKSDFPEKLRTEFRKDVDGNYIEIKTYCTFLYQLLKFIFEKHEDKEKGCVTEEMKFYSNLIRASIDTNLGEIILINALCTSKDDPWGYRKFRDLITCFNFLEHVKIDFYEYDVFTAYEHMSEVSQEEFLRKFKIDKYEAINYSDEIKEKNKVNFLAWKLSVKNRIYFYNEITRDDKQNKYYRDEAYGENLSDRHFYKRLKWQISELPSYIL